MLDDFRSIYNIGWIGLFVYPGSYECYEKKRTRDYISEKEEN